MANIHTLNQLEVCYPAVDGGKTLEFTLQRIKLLIESIFPIVCNLSSVSDLICTSILLCQVTSQWAEQPFAGMQLVLGRDA